jgi:hypothetical protein
MSKLQKKDPIIERASLFEAAVQYYISGRWAVFNRLFGVAGNLLHHAVELEIKAALSVEGNCLAQPKKYGHDLEKLWLALKKQLNDPGLDQFDGTVSALDRHEKLRHNDFVLAREMQQTINVRKTLPPSNNCPESKCELCLEDIDHMFATVFKVTGLAAAVFLGGLSPEAQQVLDRENLHLWS